MSGFLHTRSWIAVVGALGAVGLLAGGCSGDGSTTTTGTTPSTVSGGSSSVPTTAAPGPTTSAAPATTAPTVGPRVVDDVLQGGGEADGYTYEVTLPEVQGLVDAAVQDAVNADIRAGVTQVVDEFVAGTKDFTPPPAMAGQASTLTGGYEVARIDEALASFEVHASQYFAGAAHPGAVVLTFNYDVRTGQRLALADLFTAGSPYLDKLSELSRQLLAAQPGIGDLPDFVLPGTEAKAENFARWTLTDDDLVVTFNQYQVAPGAAGTPHVSIPFASLRLLLDPTGPLATYN
jgi:hypothetical protein